MSERGNNHRAIARMRKMRARSRRLSRFFIATIIVFTSFVLGFMVRGQDVFLQTLGFPSLITGISQDAATEPSGMKSVYNSISARMSEVEDILAEDSLDMYNVDDITGAALETFAKGSNDPYLRYYSNERYIALLHSQDESYAGVGVLFSEYKGQAYAVDIFEGAPAQLEGVKEGDFVVAINGDTSQIWSRNEVAAVLSQSKGSTVVITWRRPTSLEADGGEEFTTSLVCEEYDALNVTSEYDEERTVGYVDVKQLTQNAASLVQLTISDLMNHGARAIVLDMRDNPGGYLSQAVDLASLFMSSGNVVEVKTIDGQSAKTASGQPVFDGPVVVLVNKNTSSAAEVVAAALMESQRATLVGTTTMGKGSVQVLRELSFGGAMRYTAAFYLTPEGRAIDQVGVTPEILIDSSSEGDAQKDYAIELAASQIVE